MSDKDIVAHPTRCDKLECRHFNTGVLPHMGYQPYNIIVPILTDMKRIPYAIN